MPAPPVAGSVAISGPGGRLGSALVATLSGAGWDVHPWGRSTYDLDDPAAAVRSVEADRPELVIHCAAWTDVDGCARDPDLAMRRNATAVGELAEACRQGGVSLVVVSTNEVFDGRRTDGRGYTEDDRPAPGNAYGASKLAGEDAARAAFAGAASAARLWIVRTAWLYGPPGSDFPTKILAAADRLAAGERLRVVTDEVGSPTYAPDLAAAMVSLLELAEPGTYHLANSGRASRAEWAGVVLRGCGRDREVEPIRQADFERPSRAPAWAVLDTSAAARLGMSLRGWQGPLTDYLATLCPDR
ncbi:MAG TPA: dTDP-4-dehydrorhamnose reductase [Candidatus Eisenbacteria bacterium]|nr:dTDP-4-dehydrorhamnose reductase [Candidatus Eisenbacteria bacterium]